MKFNTASNGPGWLAAVPNGILLEPKQSDAARGCRIAQLSRQGMAVVLSALMIMVPMGQSTAFAQSAPPPEASQPAPQPLTPDQLDQLVAPVALYPDALVAQVLTASTYPSQVVEADRWLQAQGNASPEQIAAGANAQNWDPSVKALTAFPTVLAQLDKNIQWTTDLGNAYYNQPQDVMDSVQAMRQKAEASGNLRSTPQQTVANSDGAIVIAPANPDVVYVPVYNPWLVWGTPFPPYPGFYYAPPPGIFFGVLASGFGVGIGMGMWGQWGWGWHHWGMGWHDRAVFYNHNRYFTHSGTVINRGFHRPGGPSRGIGRRGPVARPGGGVNRGGPANRGGGAKKPGGSVGRPGAGRPPGAVGRPGGGSPGVGRPRVGRPSVGRPSGRPSGGGQPGSGGRPGGGQPSRGGHPSSGRPGGGERGR